MRRLIPALLLLSLCSCGKKDEHKDASVDTTPPAIGKVSKPRNPADVVRDRQAMGRWRSANGVLPGARNQWLILDIAGTKDARLEIRNSNFKLQTISAFASGKVVIGADVVTLSLPDASGDLAGFKSATATFPNSSTMRLKSADGRSFDLIYDGQ